MVLCRLRTWRKRAGANKPITLNPFPKVLRPSTLKTLFHKFNVFFSRGSNMDENIKIDKLDAKIEVRCPTITKDLLSKLSPEQKKNLNLKLLKVMAEAIHLSRLNYSDYLSSDRDCWYMADITQHLDKIIKSSKGRCLCTNENMEACAGYLPKEDGFQPRSCIWLDKYNFETCLRT